MSASVYIPIALILIAIVLLVLCLRFAHGLFRLVIPLGTSVPKDFLALGITLFIWTAPIHAAFYAFYNIIRQLLIFPFLNDAEAAWRDFVEQGSIFHALNKLLPNANNLLVDLDRVPFFQLLFALIVFALLVRGLNALSTDKTELWIQRLRGVPSTLWVNSLVLVIFFAGIYLSVASLCTIPMLQINQPFSEAERTQIKSQIDAYTPTQDAFDKQFPENPLNLGDSLDTLRGLFTAATGEKIDTSCPDEAKPATPALQAPAATKESPQPASSAPQPASNTPQARPAEPAANQHDSEAAILRQDAEKLTQVRSILQAYYRQRCDRQAAYRTMRSNVLKSEQTEADKVKNQVDSNFGLRLIGRERASYTYGLEADYQDFVNSTHSALSRCKSTAEAEEPLYSDYSRYMEYYLQTAVSDPQIKVYPFPFSAYSYSSGGTPMECQIFTAGRQSRSIAPTPQLGIFSFFFGWLENSDSLPLAIICGMLGVGLVGCIVSSFLRQQAAQPVDGGPWIPDIFRVIVLSFTAAIVVYLAIEGGLNIFSAETNQANPYVLLFSCLVGAVFSQDVWDAAHAKLRAANKQQEQKAKSAAQPSAKSPALAGAANKSGTNATPPSP